MNLVHQHRKGKLLWLGACLVVAGCILLVVLVFLLVKFDGPSSTHRLAGKYGFFAVGVLLYNGCRVFGAGLSTQEHFSRLGYLSLRSSVLYLRPFFSDETLVQSLRKILYRMVPSFRMFKRPVFVSSAEEDIVELFQPLGEVIALGRPGELVPPGGASRYYAEDGEWEAAIQHAIRNCKLILMRAGVLPARDR